MSTDINGRTMRQDMTKRNEPRGFSLTSADQRALIVVAIGIVVITAFLVGLLF